MIEVRMCVKSTQVSNSECLDNIQKCYRLPNLQNTRKSGLSRNHVMHSFHAIVPILLMFHESQPAKMTDQVFTPCILFTPSRQLFCCFTNHALKKGSIASSRQRAGVPHSEQKQK